MYGGNPGRTTLVRIMISFGPVSLEQGKDEEQGIDSGEFGGFLRYM